MHPITSLNYKAKKMAKSNSLQSQQLIEQIDKNSRAIEDLNNTINNFYLIKIEYCPITETLFSKVQIGYQISDD